MKRWQRRTKAFSDKLLVQLQPPKAQESQTRDQAPEADSKETNHFKIKIFCIQTYLISTKLTSVNLKCLSRAVQGEKTAAVGKMVNLKMLRFHFLIKRLKESRWQGNQRAVQSCRMLTLLQRSCTTNKRKINLCTCLTTSHP